MKKKILILIILLTFPIICLGATNPYPKTQTFNGVVSTPCTRVAWQEVYDRLGIALPGWGNAIDWYKNAANAGYQVGSEAKPNSIAVYSGFYDYGHVAFVVSVSDETMYVVENKGSGEGKTEGNRSKGIGSGEQSGLYLMGFIYVTEPKTNTSTGSTTTTTTTTKSDNSNLKSLEIENYPIDFQKDNYYYELSVPSECEKISLKTTADNSKATVKYDKEVNLNEGSNLIEIKVTAEDKSESIYVLNVTRENVEEPLPDNQNEEENNVDEIENIKEEKTEENKRFLSSYYSIIIGCIIVTVILLLITFIIWRRKKSKKYQSNV